MRFFLYFSAAYALGTSKDGCDVVDYMPASQFMRQHTTKRYHNIPNVVHRILLQPDSSIPDKNHADTANFWQNSNEDFMSVLWRDEDAVALISKNYPELQHVYDSFPHEVQRHDLLRYMILYQYGGVYADFDVHLKTNLKTLIDSVYSKEGSDATYNFLTDHEKNNSPLRRYMSSWHPIRQRAVLGSDKRESEFYGTTYFMWAAPRTQVNKALINEVARRSSYHIDVKDDYSLMFTSGSDVVATVLNQYYDIKEAGPMMDRIHIHVQVRDDALASHQKVGAQVFMKHVLHRSAFFFMGLFALALFLCIYFGWKAFLRAHRQQKQTREQHTEHQPVLQGEVSEELSLRVKASTKKKKKVVVKEKSWFLRRWARQGKEQFEREAAENLL